MNSRCGMACSMLLVVLVGMLAGGCAPAAAPPALTPTPKVGEEARPTPKPAARTEKVKLQAAGSGGTTVYFTLGKEQGYFKDQGMDLEQIVMKAALTTPALLFGEVDFSSDASTPLQSTFRGMPIRLLMGIVTKVDFFLVVAPDIKTAQDLKGKVITGGVPGAIGHIAVMEVLKTMGMADPYKEVTWINMPDPERVVALKNGSVAGIVVKASFAQMAKSMGFREMAFTADYVEAISNGLVTTDKKIKENPDQVKRMIKAAIQSMIFYRDNAEYVIQYLMKEFQMDRETAKATHEAQLRSSAVTGTVSEKSLQGMIDAFRASGAIKGPVSAEQAVNFSFLREVQKEMNLPLQPDIKIK